jgi:hypothetical protein
VRSLFAVVLALTLFGAGRPQPVLDRVRPPSDRVEVTVVTGDLEVRNRGSVSVVLGYHDVDGRPQQARLLPGGNVRWHDHRLHWMRPDPPHAARRQVLDRWSVPLTVDGAALTVSGRILWLPGPASVPTALAALAALAAVIVVARWRGLLVGLGGAAVVAGGSALVVWRQVGGAGILAAAVVLVTAAAGLAVADRSRPLVVQLVALAGLGVAILGGLAPWGDPRTSIPPVALAAGAGLAAAGLGLWRTATDPLGGRMKR